MKRFFIACIGMMLMNCGISQRAKDTTAMIRELNKVMSFATSPYVHYTTLTRMDATPVIQGSDTGSIKGVYFKNGSNIYYHNGHEEFFLEDSLLVLVNDNRQSIMISKVDAEAKAKVDAAPLDNRKIQDLFRKGYSIQRTVLTPQTARMDFESKQKGQGTSEMETRIALEYALENWIPSHLEMEMSMKQRADDAILASLAEEGIDASAIIQTLDDVKYLVRRQRVRIFFQGIDTSKEKAAQIPSWRSRIEYNEDKHEYHGREKYSGYEVTTTF